MRTKSAAVVCASRRSGPRRQATGPGAGTLVSRPRSSYQRTSDCTLKRLIVDHIRDGTLEDAHCVWESEREREARSEREREKIGVRERERR